MNSKIRYTQIDGLRGIAAVFVMLFHYTFVFNSDFSLGKIFHYGYLGVPLFFIISGFVITKSLESTNTPSLFIIGRAIRLYPSYWICLFLTIISMYFSGLHNERLNSKIILANITMFQRFFGILDIDGAYWTLAIELMFYLIVWLLLLVKLKDKLKEIMIILVCIVFAIRVCIYFFKVENLFVINGVNQLRYFHLFLAGTVLFTAKDRKLTKNEIIILLLCLVFNLFAKLRFNVLVETFVVGVFFAVFRSITNGKNIILIRILNGSILQFLGKISYPLYLLNENFGSWMFAIIDNMIGNYVLFKILIVSLVLVLASAIVYFVIERPVLFKLKPYLIRNKKFKQ